MLRAVRLWWESFWGKAKSRRKHLARSTVVLERKGSFDCGCTSLLRRTAFAQDTTLELSLVFAAPQVVDEHLFYRLIVSHQNVTDGVSADYVANLFR